MESTQSSQPKKKRNWWKWAFLILVALLFIAAVSKPRAVTVTEAQLNAKLEEGLGQPADNPLTASHIDLREDVGVLTMSWQKGQALTANIVVAPNGTLLVAQDVRVTGAGVLNEVFEGVAKLVLANLLTNVSVSQRNLSHLDINDDALVVTYTKK